MRIPAYRLLMLIAALLATTAEATVALTPHTAEYKVQISVISGKLRTDLRKTDDGYVATHFTKPSGFSKMLARGSITDIAEFEDAGSGIIPTAYRSNDSLSRDKVSADIRFDWDSNEATGTVNGEEALTKLAGLSHDRVSIQYELMHDLLNGGTSAQYQLYEVDKLKTINVRSIGHKRVKVPAGTFEAIGIQHQAEGSSRVTTLWCVEELGYLPVIIEQHRKGKRRVRVTLRKYNPK